MHEPLMQELTSPPSARFPIADIAPPKSVAGGNLFIPISLGNHYYSSDVLRRVLADFIAPSRQSVIFLCDRLRLLSYRIRGETDLERIGANIRLQLSELTRSLMHLGLRAHPNAVVADWSLLASDPRHDRLLAVLEDFVRVGPILRRKLDDYARQLMYRFRGSEGGAGRDSGALQGQCVSQGSASWRCM